MGGGVRPTQAPAVNEIKQLPLRAIVAYAVRCARRVQPIFQLSAEVENRVKHYKEVDANIRLADAWACTSLTLADAEAPPEATRAVVGSTYDAGCAAAAAINAARAAVSPVAASRAINSATAAAAAATAATRAAAAFGSFTVSRDAATHAARSDFEKLVGLELGGPREIGEPVNMKQLGPLWPDGPPVWWHAAYAEMRQVLDAADTETSTDDNHNV